MSRGYNHVTLEGNLVRDPDIRYSANKQKCARFTLAIGNDYKSKDGQVVKRTDFIDCVAWGALADILEKYTKKGNAILIDGQIERRDYERDGQKKYITEVVARNAVLLSFVQNNNNDEAGFVGSGQAQTYMSSSNTTADEAGDYDADESAPNVHIPF